MTAKQAENHVVTKVELATEKDQESRRNRDEVHESKRGEFMQQQKWDSWQQTDGKQRSNKLQNSRQQRHRNFAVTGSEVHGSKGGKTMLKYNWTSLAKKGQEDNGATEAYLSSAHPCFSCSQMLPSDHLLLRCSLFSFFRFLTSVALILACSPNDLPFCFCVSLQVKSPPSSYPKSAGGAVCIRCFPRSSPSHPRQLNRRVCVSSVVPSA